MNSEIRNIVIRKSFMVSIFLFGMVHSLTRIYPEYSFGVTCMWILVSFAAFVTLIATIGLKKPVELLWGIGISIWIMYIAHHFMFRNIACILEFIPSIGYCIWTIYRLESKNYQIYNKQCILKESIPASLSENLKRYNGKNYEELSGIFLLLAGIGTILGLFVFALDTTIPREAATRAMLSFVTLMIVNLVFIIIVMIIEYFMKKTYNLVIYIVTILGLSVGLIPGIIGFGWGFIIIVGIPWGLAGYFRGKSQQEKLRKKYE